jgi:hypothetical protein
VPATPLAPPAAWRPGGALGTARGTHTSRPLVPALLQAASTSPPQPDWAVFVFVFILLLPIPLVCSVSTWWLSLIPPSKSPLYSLCATDALRMYLPFRLARIDS